MEEIDIKLAEIINIFINNLSEDEKIKARNKIKEDIKVISKFRTEEELYDNIVRSCIYTLENGGKPHHNSIYIHMKSMGDIIRHLRDNKLYCYHFKESFMCDGLPSTRDNYRCCNRCRELFNKLN